MVSMLEVERYNEFCEKLNFEHRRLFDSTLKSALITASKYECELEELKILSENIIQQQMAEPYKGRDIYKGQDINKSRENILEHFNKITDTVLKKFISQKKNELIEFFDISKNILQAIRDNDYIQLIILTAKLEAQIKSQYFKQFARELNENKLADRIWRIFSDLGATRQDILKLAKLNSIIESEYTLGNKVAGSYQHLFHFTKALTRSYVLNKLVRYGGVSSEIIDNVVDNKILDNKMLHELEELEKNISNEIKNQAISDQELKDARRILAISDYEAYVLLKKDFELILSTIKQEGSSSTASYYEIKRLIEEYYKYYNFPYINKKNIKNIYQAIISKNNSSSSYNVYENILKIIANKLNYKLHVKNNRRARIKSAKTTSPAKIRKGQIIIGSSENKIYQSEIVLPNGARIHCVQRESLGYSSESYAKVYEIIKNSGQPFFLKHYFNDERWNADLDIKQRIEFIEFAPCGNLAEYPLTLDEIPTIFYQIITGVQFLHSRQIAHLDLKLENILLGDDGKPKIIDFNRSRMINEKVRDIDSTREYYAPEFRGNKDHSQLNYFAQDIWALGGILYRFYTGKTLIDENKNFIGTKNLFKDCEFFAKCDNKYINPKAKAVKQVIKKLLTIDPDKRIENFKTITNSAYFYKESNLSLFQEITNKLRENNRGIDLTTELTAAEDAACERMARFYRIEDESAAIRDARNEAEEVYKEYLKRIHKREQTPEDNAIFRKLLKYSDAKDAEAHFKKDYINNYLQKLKESRLPALKNMYRERILAYKKRRLIKEQDEKQKQAKQEKKLRWFEKNFGKSSEIVKQANKQKIAINFKIPNFHSWQQIKRKLIVEISKQGGLVKDIYPERFEEIEKYLCGYFEEEKRSNNSEMLKYAEKIHKKLYELNLNTDNTRLQRLMDEVKQQINILKGNNPFICAHFEETMNIRPQANDKVEVQLPYFLVVVPTLEQWLEDSTRYYNFGIFKIERIRSRGTLELDSLVERFHSEKLSISKIDILKQLIKKCDSWLEGKKLTSSRVESVKKLQLCAITELSSMLDKVPDIAMIDEMLNRITKQKTSMAHSNKRFKSFMFASKPMAEPAVTDDGCMPRSNYEDNQTMRTAA